MSLKFHLITDLHLRASSLPPLIDSRDQVDLNNSARLISALFRRLKNDNEVDLILLAGDFTQDGDRASCNEFFTLLKGLKDSGKRIVALPASHDYDSGEMLREEVNALYKPFASDMIISSSKNGFSYVARLCDGVRLLVLSVDEMYYPDELIEWSLAEIKSAREAGDYIFGMQHYPYLPPTALFSLFGGNSDIPKNYKEVGELFCDAGLNVMFCGHSHMHTIMQSVTPSKSPYYSVSTSALTGYPAKWRTATLTDGTFDIESVSLSQNELIEASIPLDGKTPRQYFRDHFKLMLEEIFFGAAHDIELLKKRVTSFSVKPAVVQKNKRLIRLLGKFLYKRTVGTLSGLLFFKRKIDKPTRRLILKDVIIDIICYVYSGDPPYTPDTSLYRAAELLFKRIRPLVSLFDKSGEIRKILDAILKNMFYKAGMRDDNAKIIS